MRNADSPELTPFRFPDAPAFALPDDLPEPLPLPFLRMLPLLLPLPLPLPLLLLRLLANPPPGNPDRADDDDDDAPGTQTVTRCPVALYPCLMNCPLPSVVRSLR